MVIHSHSSEVSVHLLNYIQCV